MPAVFSQEEVDKRTYPYYGENVSTLPKASNGLVVKFTAPTTGVVVIGSGKWSAGNTHNRFSEWNFKVIDYDKYVK